MTTRTGEAYLIMGLGVHGGGLGVARWLLRRGAQVTITDLASPEALAKPLAALRQAEKEFGATITYVLGEHRVKDFTSHAVVVANPAVRPDSPWLQAARAAGARIETEMTLFFRHCASPILGITGTKGKTTTALLTAAILRQRYPQTVVAGNLRVSALESLDQITSETPVVLELSSFQLMGLGNAGFSPQYACITNFSPDHLNYHHTLEEYAQAKSQIFLHQAVDDVLVLDEAEQAFWLKHLDRQAKEALALKKIKTFSVQQKATADCQITVKGEIRCCGLDLCTLNDLDQNVLPGKHNLANVLAAATLARSFGLSPEQIRAGIIGFKGVEHRLETVLTYFGIRYINDSTATNPVAAQAALASFSEPIVLIAGGASKGLALESLGKAVAQRVKALVLLAGSATAELEEAVRRNTTSAFPILGPYSDFAVALENAQRVAAPGDLVLLSPGCASFGMFQNEFHRGEEFRRIVKEQTQA